MKKHNLQWFKNRIGKRIYRLTHTNCCKHCQNVFENGLEIMSDTHADYIFCVQNELELEYADEKEKWGWNMRKCKHIWTQVDKEFYISDDGMPAKKLIDACLLCGKRRER